LKVGDIKTVAVIGAGLISPGVAQNFAANNFDVWIYARRPEVLPEAVGRIKNNLVTMAQRDIITEKEIDPILKRVKTTSNLEEAAKGSQLIIECVAENMEVKQDMFQRLDKMCPTSTILATNTSVMSPTEIASKSVHRERIVGAHFWNPAHLIPCVEVVKAKETSEEVFNVTYEVMKKAGKHPVKCLKDVPGFIANRLQHALWREAISIVENGIADAATVDEAIKSAFAVRLPVLGPMENADMVGLDLTLSIHNYVLKAIDSRPGPSPMLEEKVKKGELGFKSGKGFQTWSAEDIKASRERLNNYLLDWLKRQKK